MAKAKDELPWSAFNKDTKTQVRNDFRDNIEWIARITMGSEKRFKALHRDEGMPFDPESESNYLERRQAERLITLAKFLAERTDDPKTGVGAVIINKEPRIKIWPRVTRSIRTRHPRSSNAEHRRHRRRNLRW